MNTIIIIMLGLGIVNIIIGLLVQKSSVVTTGNVWLVGSILADLIIDLSNKG